MQGEVVRKFLLFSIVIIIVGCGYYYNRSQASDFKGYLKMMQSTFNTIHDVVVMFPKNQDEIEKQAECAIEATQKDLADILRLDNAKRSFANTPGALDLAGRKFGIAQSVLNVVEMVHPDKDMRDAAHKAVLKMNTFAVDAFMNRDLYRAFKGYVEGNAKEEKLSSVQKYHLDEEMRDFKRQGFDLPDDQFAKVKELKKELSQLCQKFDREIAADNSTVVVDRDGLLGVSGDILSSLKKTDDGKFILGCDYPTVYEVLENCSIPQTRRSMYLTFLKRAYKKNIDRLHSIIAKRDKLAQILKFPSYAHLDTDGHMVKTPERAEQFLREMHNKSRDKEQKEYEQFVADLPDGAQLTDDGKFQPWDRSYVKTQFKKKYFDLDERLLAEYFPVKKTLEGVFSIYQQFLGVTFERVAVSGAWHKDVSCIIVRDKHDNQLLGYIFLDLYPREGKYNHACLAPIMCPLNQKAADGHLVRIPAISVIIANFPKATADKPALFKHDDVKTFFHEFGHAMHNLFGCTELNTFSGFNVKWDFVEVPSQMFEEWMWDKQILKMISSHYKTGEPLPDEFIDKKLALKRVDSGSFVQRQSFLSFLVLAYFKPGEQKDSQAIWQQFHEAYCPHVRFEPETYFQASFGHLTGYGAKYYTYLWSKVFSLDLFDYIKKNGGLLDETIGRAFVSKVLAKGGSEDPEDLLKDFLGREPNKEAFLKDLL
jgi:thimet oligopeptidase